MRKITNLLCAMLAWSVGWGQSFVINENGHEAVRLWDDGPYWATTNIGAEEPEEAGCYFWWGDVVGYKQIDDGNRYGWLGSDGQFVDIAENLFNRAVPSELRESELLRLNWCEFYDVYKDGETGTSIALTAEHDAATTHWGGDWRMPRLMEAHGLIQNCDWHYVTTNGVEGYVVSGRGKYAEARIFLPAAGYVWATLHSEMEAHGFKGLYWIADEGIETADANTLCFRDDGNHKGALFDDICLFPYMSRREGCPIRPVLPRCPEVDPPTLAVGDSCGFVMQEGEFFVRSLTVEGALETGKITVEYNSDDLPPGIKIGYSDKGKKLVVSGTPETNGVFVCRIKLIQAVDGCEEAASDEITMMFTICCKNCCEDVKVITHEESHSVTLSCGVRGTESVVISSANGGNKTKFVRTSGKMPAGIDVKYDETKRSVVLSGETNASGVHKVGYTLIEDLCDECKIVITDITINVQVGKCEEKKEECLDKGMPPQLMLQKQTFHQSRGDVVNKNLGTKNIQGRDIVSIAYVSGALPPGVMVSYDSATKRVHVGGVVAGAGNCTYTYVFRLDAVRGDCGEVQGVENVLEFVIKDPPDDPSALQTIKVTFDANGGTCATTTGVYTVGTPFGTLPVPTWNSHTFEGWFTAISNGAQIVETTVVPDTNMTLYAHWENSSSADDESQPENRSRLADVEWATPLTLANGARVNMAFNGFVKIADSWIIVGETALTVSGTANKPKLSMRLTISGTTFLFTSKSWLKAEDETYYSVLSARNGEKIKLWIGDKYAAGMIDDGYLHVYLARNRAAAKDMSAIKPFVGNYTASVNGGILSGYLQISIKAAKNAVAVKGVLSNGITISTTAALLDFGVKDGAMCAPVYMSKKGKHTFCALLWITPTGLVEGDSALSPFILASSPTKYSDVFRIEGARFSPSVVEGVKSFTFSEPLKYFDKKLGGYVTAVAEASPNGMAVEVANGKIMVPKATMPKKSNGGVYEYNGSSDSGMKLAYVPATGVLKGSFKLYYDWQVGGKWQHKAVMTKVQGVAVGDRFVGFASVPQTNPVLKKSQKVVTVPLELRSNRTLE